MEAPGHPLEPFFHQVVRNSYEGKLGLNDPDVTGYVAHLLCEFSEAKNLYKVRDRQGHPIEELEAMMLAADPVNGSAPSFDAERSVRKYIGDYALFVSRHVSRSDCARSTPPRFSPEPGRAGPRRQGKLLHREPVQLV